MNHKRVLIVCVALLMLLIPETVVMAQGPKPGARAPRAALGSAFTYQGQLRNNGTAVNGSCSLAFGLWDAVSGGTQIGTNITQTITITNGLFTTLLDFGANAFDGSARYLAIAAACPSGTGFTLMTPRQQLTATPYALYSVNAGTTGQLQGFPVNATAPTTNQVLQWNGSAWTPGTVNETIYTAGTGLTLNGNQFSAVTSTLQQRVSSSCGTGYAVRVVNQDGSVICEPIPSTSTYTAGYGLLLSSGQFSIVTSTMQQRVSSACGIGNAIRVVNQDGTVTCEPISSYAAGLGLSLSNGQFSVVTSTVQQRITGTCGTGYAVRVVNQDGSVTCEPMPIVVTYTAGSGLTLTGNQFSAVTSTLQQRVNSSCGTGYAVRVVNQDGSVTCEPMPNSWNLSGNSGTNSATNFIGTTDNISFSVRVNNTKAFQFAPNVTSPNLIGGYGGNWVTNGAYGAVIGGGGQSGNLNRVTDHMGTIGGGQNNQAGDNNGDVANATFATVSGGSNNLANGGSTFIGGGQNNTATGSYSTIGGGQSNSTSGGYSTVAGGLVNKANDSYSFIGAGINNTINSGGMSNGIVAGSYNEITGGSNNFIGGGRYNTIASSGTLNSIVGGYSNVITSTATYSFIGGGLSNQVSGNYAFAGGRRANAANSGCFVWGDSTNATVACGAADQFVVRASGGVIMYTNAALNTGVQVAPGSGSWSSISDKNLKANFTHVDGRDILARVNSLPLTTWNYKAQEASVRHIGPMAQDFAAAFGVGENDTTISTVDADGVALAAIQGLSQENQQLKSQVAAQQKQIDTLEVRLSALEQNTGTHTNSPFDFNAFAFVALLVGALMFYRSRK